MISVIIPTLNEEARVGKTLAAIRDSCRHAELIVVDGGSQDGTCAIAKQYATVLHAKPPRSRQMNLGARHAQGEMLVFASADTHYPSELCMLIERVHGIGGGFLIRFDHPHWLFRLIEWSSNARARFLKIFYLDQSIFVRADAFWKAGGFPDVETMEETALCRKLKTMGDLVCVPQYVSSSPRRFLANGILRTWLTMGVIRILYSLGASQKLLKCIWQNIKYRRA